MFAKNMTPEEKREKRLRAKREWNRRNAHKQALYFQKWYAKPENSERVRDQVRRYGKENREICLAKKKIWRANHPEKVQKYQERYITKNRDAILLREAVRRKTEKVKNYKAQWMRDRRRDDPNFKLLSNLRCRIYFALKDRYSRKSARTMDLIGCPLSFLRKHLEDQFKPGMSWGNYGEWHVDHMMPCARFDLTDPLQQKICFHFTNLQPLWAVENLSKGAR